MESINIIFYLKEKIYNHANRRFSLWGKVAFLYAPFILLLILYSWVAVEKVLYSPTYFYFLNDYSNGISMPLLMIFGYYVCAFYPGRASMVINETRKLANLMFVDDKHRTVSREKSFCFKPIIYNIVILVLCTSSASNFVTTAKKTSAPFWMCSISDILQFYYMVILTITWYFSFVILIVSIKNSINIYKALLNIDAMSLDPMAVDNHFGLKACKDLITFHILEAIYFSLGLILIILTDHVSHHLYEINNTFYAKPVLAIILIGFFILVLIATIVPYIELVKVINLNRARIINELDKKIKIVKEGDKESSNELEKLCLRRDQYLNIGRTRHSFKTEIFAIFTSIFIPSIGILVQIIQLI